MELEWRILNDSRVDPIERDRRSVARRVKRFCPIPLAGTVTSASVHPAPLRVARWYPVGNGTPIQTFGVPSLATWRPTTGSAPGAGSMNDPCHPSEARASNCVPPTPVETTAPPSLWEVTKSSVSVATTGWPSGVSASARVWAAKSAGRPSCGVPWPLAIEKA